MRQLMQVDTRSTAAWVIPLVGWSLVLGLLAPPAAAEALPKQILIEAQIWELSNDDGMDWGIIWDYDRKEDSSGGDLNIFSANLRLPVFDEGGDPAKGLFATGDIFDLRFGIMTLRIQAALREGRAELLANPKVVVLNGTEATINSGEEVPIIKFAYEKNVQTFKTVFENTGISLWVKPYIHEASPEFVLLDIRPEVREITRYEKLTSPDGEFELPLLTSRSAQSKVLVRSGQILVMGGLYQEQAIQNEKGLPGLKDIPLAGRLFQSKTMTREKRDLLIEIRPTILVPGRDSFLPVPLSRPVRGQPTETSEVRSGARAVIPPSAEPQSTGERSGTRPAQSSGTASGAWY